VIGRSSWPYWGPTGGRLGADLEGLAGGTDDARRDDGDLVDTRQVTRISAAEGPNG